MSEKQETAGSITDLGQTMDKAIEKLGLPHLEPVPGEIPEETIDQLRRVCSAGILDAVPFHIWQIAELAIRCRQPIDPDMTVEAAMAEIQKIQLALTDFAIWSATIDNALIHRNQNLYKLIAAADLTDTKFEQDRDDAAEGGAQ